MNANEKAAVNYMPAPTGHGQPPSKISANNVSHPTEYFNENISRDGLKLIRMGGVEVTEINWLWYPYIPYGKISVVQGDPGNGKTSMVLAIAAALTKGDTLPESATTAEPINVIFQTAEDGLGDTVKPRLLQAGADCDRIIVIDESEKELSLSDDRIEEALIQTGAKLFILDPLQAYLGADVDMHRANEVRPILKRMSQLADKTGCAVVVVGHLNKGTNQSQYRGLGSIDIQAAARSVLTVGRINGDNKYLRAFAQGKNNLAPEGKSIAFELDPVTGFRWVGSHPITIDELLNGKVDKETAAELAQTFLVAELTGKIIPAKDIFEMADERDISGRTLKRVKSAAGVRSFKKNNQWFWTIGHDISEPQKQGRQDILAKNLASLAPYAESGGITRLDENRSGIQKQGRQEYHIGNLAPLPPCADGGDADGKN
jgi:archaellum biogenesis ATPase FlaH